MKHTESYMTGIKYAVLDVVVKDTQMARMMFEQAILQGDQDAYYMLGRLYALGEGVSRDYIEAKRLFEKGITFKSTHAYVGLAMLYYLGHGVDKDEESAHDLVAPIISKLEKEVQNEDVVSTYLLGTVYYYGLGLRPSMIDALRYFKQAAAQGYADACYMTGLLLESFAESKEQKNEAIAYYQKAAKQSHVYAMYGLAMAYFQLKQDKEALMYLEQAMAQNYDLAYYTYAIYHDEIVQNYDVAFHAFEKAVKLHYEKAYYYLGLYYYLGRGVEQDLNQASTYLKLSIEKLADARSYYQLGMMKLKEHLYLEAFDLFEKAAKQNHKYAQYNLAVMYQRGEGITIDLERAFFYYKQAADQDFGQAEYNVAMMYFKGEGCEKNLEHALFYFTRAKEKGLKQAEDMLIAIQNAQFLDDTLHA